MRPRLFSLFSREVRRLRHDPVYAFCMIVAPLLCFFFFTSLMDNGLPQELPVGVVDGDGTTTSRSIARNLDAFPQTRIVARYTDVSEARRAVQRGDIYGFYYIPAGTGRMAMRQERPTLSFYTNYSYLVAGSLIYKDMRTMSELAAGSAARSVLYARGATDEQAMAYLQPIVVETHPVGNPWLNYNVYLSNTLVPGVLMLFVFMITVYGIGTEIKEGSGRGLLREAGGNVLTALWGKILPQAAIFLLIGSCYVFYLYGVLHFPCHCGIGRAWALMALFVLASQGLGVLMITALPTLRLGLSFASLWGVISFSICGMSFPVMAMHPVLQGLAWLFPLRHYFLLYVNSVLDGYPLLNAWPHLLALVGFAALPYLLAPRLRYVLKHAKYEK